MNGDRSSDQVSPITTAANFLLFLPVASYSVRGEMAAVSQIFFSGHASDLRAPFSWSSCWNISPSGAGSDVPLPSAAPSQEQQCSPVLLAGRRQGSFLSSGWLGPAPAHGGWSTAGMGQGRRGQRRAQGGQQTATGYGDDSPERDQKHPSQSLPCGGVCGVPWRRSTGGSDGPPQREWRHWGRTPPKGTGGDRRGGNWPDLRPCDGGQQEQLSQCLLWSCCKALLELPQ
mmetsp:Transcript_18325/g.41918  ORF Transcript_18325/g.41918 Transcript_18325/m.41918 type:complete len:229 (+) Transcript_18325:279-965(+)